MHAVGCKSSREDRPRLAAMRMRYARSDFTVVFAAAVLEAVALVFGAAEVGGAGVLSVGRA